MNSGQRQPPDSRLTTATVLMHWQARTKNTISETPASGVMSARAVRPGRARAARSRSGSLVSSAPAMSKTTPSVPTNTSRAANAPRMPTPMRQSKPSGRDHRFDQAAERPATLLRSCAPPSGCRSRPAGPRALRPRGPPTPARRAGLLGLGRDHGRILRIRQQRPHHDGQREDHGAGIEQERPDALPDAAQQHAEHRQAIRRQFEHQRWRRSLQHGPAQDRRGGERRNDRQRVHRRTAPPHRR